MGFDDGLGGVEVVCGVELVTRDEADGTVGTDGTVVGAAVGDPPEPLVHAARSRTPAAHHAIWLRITALAFPTSHP